MSDERPAPETPEGGPQGLELPQDFTEDGEVAQLVQRAQAGDAQALNDLFERYHATMMELARKKLGPRLRAKEEPDDLAQTTFREAARDFQSFTYRGEDSLLRWLIQILQNKIRDKAEFYSAGKRDTSRETSADAPLPGSDDDSPREFPAHDLSVTQVVRRKENIALLYQAIQELSEDHRKAITLVFFRGLTLREAGEQFDPPKTEDAVRMMLRRAEAKLGELLPKDLG